MRKALTIGVGVICLLSTRVSRSRPIQARKIRTTGRNTIGLPMRGDIVRSIRSTRTMSANFRSPGSLMAATSPWAFRKRQ